MKFYIICPIENRSAAEWTQKLEDAKDLLRSLGLCVVNGSGTLLTLGSQIKDALSVDMPLLLSATNVLVVDGWLSCTKARAEHHIAQTAGLGIWYEKDMFYDRPQMLNLIKAISDVTGLSFYEWTNQSRTTMSFFARMIFCYYCHFLLGMNNTEIGRIINRDRTTCSYALQGFRAEYDHNKEFKRMADAAIAQAQAIQ